MTEQIQTPKSVNMKIGPDRYIKFASQDDAILFLAIMFPFKHFSYAYYELCNEFPKPALYHEKRKPASQKRYGELIRSTYLEDGTLLIDALKAKLVEKPRP